MLAANRISLLFVAFLFCLGACTELPSLGSAKTSEEREAIAATRSLVVRSNAIILKNTLQGAGLGALIGGGGTLIAGGSTKDAVRNAGIGAAAGAAGGAAVGSAVGNADSEIQARKKALEKLNQTNAQVTEARSKVQSALNAQNRELNTLRKQLRAGEVTRAQYDARVTSMNNTRKALKENLARSSQSLEKKRANVTDSTISSRTKSVENRIDSINREIRLLSTG